MRVAVAMSGGVDSSAAALILTEAGHEVIGLYMGLHPQAEESWEAAQGVAEQIGIECLGHIDIRYRKHHPEELCHGQLRLSFW